MSTGNESLIKYKDIHEGERGFIIGGGPSVRETNLNLLKNEIILTTGLSSFERYSNYHFVGDESIVKQKLNILKKLSTDILFTSKGIHDKYDFEKLKVEYFVGHGKIGFHTNVCEKIYGGGTSIFVALEFAHFMGISPVYLLGIDHKWDYSNTVSHGMSENGKHEILENTGEDLNHHSKYYFFKNTLWHKPKIEKIEESYVMARQGYFITGRRLYNASIQTELSEKIIPRVDYYSLFNHD